jgi:hypothetical protein
MTQSDCLALIRQHVTETCSVFAMKVSLWHTRRRSPLPLNASSAEVSARRCPTPRGQKRAQSLTRNGRPEEATQCGLGWPRPRSAAMRLSQGRNPEAGREPRCDPCVRKCAAGLRSTARALKFAPRVADIYVRSPPVDQMFGVAVLTLSFVVSLGAARAILGILVGGLDRRLIRPDALDHHVPAA